MSHTIIPTHLLDLIASNVFFENQTNMIEVFRLLIRVIVKSGVWAFSSSGDLIILHDFDTVFKFNSSNNFPEAVEAA